MPDACTVAIHTLCEFVWFTLGMGLFGRENSVLAWVVCLFLLMCSCVVSSKQHAAFGCCGNVLFVPHLSQTAASRQPLSLIFEVLEKLSAFSILICLPMQIRKYDGFEQIMI